jgi:pSer/pThr/pTyr-binding forkhead associated (FHA) protein
MVQACTVRQRARDVITAFPRSVLLREGEYIIGREARADVRVVNESVSLRHARLVMKDDMATVEDLGSQSGTYVGETRIGPPYPLYDGDEIRLGALVLTFRRVAKRRTT